MAIPGTAASLDEVHARTFQCWNPSCRRCGPIVGRADFARLAKAIKGRQWAMLVITVAPDEGSKLLEQAHARRRRALETLEHELRERGEDLPWKWEEPPASAPIDERFGWQQSRLVALEEHAIRTLAIDVVLPKFTSPELSSNIFHAAQQAFTKRLREQIRKHFGVTDYVLTWEITKKDRPHANVLIDAERLWRFVDASGGWTWKKDRTRFRREGRLCRFSKPLRDLLQQWAIDAGFGDKRFWCEVAMPEDDALAGYVSKLALEMSGSVQKKQAPINRPKGFRRYTYSFELLDTRIWPKGAHCICPVKTCEHVPPPKGWCSRTIIRHLIEAHEWKRSDAWAVAAMARAKRKEQRGDWHSSIVDTRGLEPWERWESIAVRLSNERSDNPQKRMHAAALAALMHEHAEQLKEAAEHGASPVAEDEVSRVRA